MGGAWVAWGFLFLRSAYLQEGNSGDLGGEFGKGRKSASMEEMMELGTPNSRMK